MKEVIRIVEIKTYPDQYLDWDIVAYDWDDFDPEIHKVNPLTAFSKPSFTVVFSGP